MVKTMNNKTPDFNRNIKLTIAYDGTCYHGFQRQSNALAIQEILETRLSVLFGHPLKITGAGRTDAGVHAYGQTVNFLTSGSTIPAGNIPKAARGLLPPDIVVTAGAEVPLAFHARRSAQSKIYIYRVLQSPLADPFRRNYSWHISQPLNVAGMSQAAQYIIGTHDFSAFRAAGGSSVKPVRTIFEASCSSLGQLIEFSFWGNGFLYHMVRNLVGTLIQVGQGRLTAEQFAGILLSRDRTQAGITAPPQGLYLKEVRYSR